MTSVPRPPLAPVALDPTALDALLQATLAEDVGTGDITTESSVDAASRAEGRLIAKASGVVAGLDVFARVFTLLDPDVRIEALLPDGTAVVPGDVVATLAGPARALLTGERTALNLLQRMSGVATLTAEYVSRTRGAARILDTRKTTPGLRALEKYAVRIGGGENHRFALYDEAMIKDNHTDLSREPLAAIVDRIRASGGASFRVTIEARTDAEALAAVEAGADVVLLDNRTPKELTELTPRLRAAARERGAEVELEASGGITLETVEAFATSGVDRISVGALTHSAPALDLSLELNAEARA